MKIARILVKQSAISELQRDYPKLLQDDRIIVEIQFDGKFNKQMAVDQIEEYNSGKTKAGNRD